MSNVEDWERRNALPFGCALTVTILSFLFAAFFIGYPVWRWLRNLPQEMRVLPLLGIGLFFLSGGVGFTWRLIKRKPIPYVRSGGEPPPPIEIYDFLPKDESTKR
jgi:hypothetical protein